MARHGVRGTATSLSRNLRSRNSFAQMQAQKPDFKHPETRHSPRAEQVKRLLGGNYAVA